MVSKTEHNLQIPWKWSGNNKKKNLGNTYILMSNIHEIEKIYSI